MLLLEDFVEKLESSLMENNAQHCNHMTGQDLRHQICFAKSMKSA